MPDPNTTILASGQDGPTVIASYDPATSNPWFALRSYGRRDGTGPFFQFQAPDSNGTIYDAVVMNGGFIKTQAGKVSSDIDIMGWSEGQRFQVSICGAADGFPACLVSDPANFVALGSSFGRWTQLWLQEFPIPAKYATLPGHPKTCVHVSGKIVPLYDP